MVYTLVSEKDAMGKPISHNNPGVRVRSHGQVSRNAAKHEELAYVRKPRGLERSL